MSKLSQRLNSPGSPMIIIGILFFVFGFITWLGSVLIPYLKIACELNNFESYLVTFSFYISYFIMAIPSSWLLLKTGYKKGISLGLFIMATGTFMFIPAALDRNYLLFLAGLFIQGTGLAILQTAANPYVTILGPRNSAAKRISVMGICNGMAGVSAPLILGWVMLSDADHISEAVKSMDAIAKENILNDLAHKVIYPYLIMMGGLLLLAVMVYFSGLPELNTEPESDEDNTPALPLRKSVFDYPHFIWGAITLFFYVGVEVIAIDTIISYASSQGIPLSTGKFYSSLTLINMLVGYIIGILLIPKHLSQEQALKICASVGVMCALMALMTSGVTSIIFISFLGLANSLIWPSIWPLATNGLGVHLKKGSGIMIMAIGGGALLPLLYGKLADVYNPHHAYWLLVPCYVIIIFYAFRGHKVRLG
jgi:glucose/galactose transporter